MAVRESIKVIHAALDEAPGNAGDIILRGVIDPQSLNLLQVAEYQRGIQPLNKIRALAEAFRKQEAVPDIELGMRGGNYDEREGVYYLADPVFIIDGLQRTTGAMEAMKSDCQPRLGATVHFNTTEPWEKDLFRKLNILRAKLSPNITLRNARDQHPALEMLYNLTQDRAFVMHGRVCWEQRMKREELVSARSFVQLAGLLHYGFTSGVSQEGAIATRDSAMLAYDRLMARIGRNTMRNNVRRYWDLIDECWGLRKVHFKEGAVYLRGAFLKVMTQLLANPELLG